MTSFINKYYSIIFILFLVTIVGLSFYLGYEKGSSSLMGNKEIVFSCPNTILDKQRITSAAPIKTALTNDNLGSVSTLQTGGEYMGSKNGTKYYTPNCPASKRIKPENIIWFQSAEDATLQGYSKGSC